MWDGHRSGDVKMGQGGPRGSEIRIKGGQNDGVNGGYKRGPGEKKKKDLNCIYTTFALQHLG